MTEHMKDVPETDLEGLSVSRFDVEEVMNAVSSDSITGYVTPYQFQVLKKKFQAIKDAGKEVWIEDKDLKQPGNTGRFKVIYVDNRKALCEYIDPVRMDGSHPYKIKVTINYGDLVSKGSTKTVKVLDD